MQKTIQNPVSCYGIGVHSGDKTQITLKPASANTGIVFVRTDVSQCNNVVIVNYSNVCDTTMSTSIKNSAGIKVCTVEHLLAAIWGAAIDNIIIELDGPEVPIMDGSSKPFLFMLSYAGVQEQSVPTRSLKLKKKIYVVDNGCEIIAQPYDGLQVELSIDFTSAAIGYQSQSLCSRESFKSNIADARTFGFVHELEYLKSKGLAKGASLDNAIGIDGDVILNHNGLRYKDEFVRHKILDLVGDLMNAGGYFCGKISGYKTNHSLNNQFLHKIFEDCSAYEWVKNI